MRNPVLKIRKAPQSGAFSCAQFELANLNVQGGGGRIRTAVQTSSKDAFYTLSFCRIFVCVFGQKPTETQLIFSDTTSLQKPLNSRIERFDTSGETGRSKVFAEAALT